MPRNYKPTGKKTYKKYDELLIKQALEELSSNRETIRSIARKYNISKSVLQRHNTRFMRPTGGQLSLSKEAEEHIVRNLNVCAEWGYPLDVLDLRIIIKSYLDSLKIVHKRFKNNLPGRDFTTNFLKRHKDIISQRICQNIKRSRAAISPETISDYFSELQKSLENVPLANILNYDETNLSDDPGRKKVITKRGCKYPERVVNHSKASVSIMMAGTAEGELLPPYVCYKATFLYNTWRSNGPVGSWYNRTPSGWFDSEVFKDWVETIILPFFENKSGKKVLIGDNLSSHLSVELISLCKEKDVHFVFLPANSTHLTQPLDVAFFRPMKIAWRQILTKWKKTDGRSQTSVPKGCFPRMLKVLMEQLEENSQNNLKSGFRKTGISPFNPDEVLSRLPQEPTNDSQEREAIDLSVVNLLKEMRFGTMNIVEPKKKRKLNVVPGRSVCNEEVENYDEIETEPTSTKKTLKGKGKGKKTKPQMSNSIKTYEVDKEHIESNSEFSGERKSIAGPSAEPTNKKKPLGDEMKTKEPFLGQIEYEQDINNKALETDILNTDHNDYTVMQFGILDRHSENNKRRLDKNKNEEVCLKKIMEPVNKKKKILRDQNIVKETEVRANEKKKMRGQQSVHSSIKSDLESMNIENMPIISAEDSECKNIESENININNMTFIPAEDLECRNVAQDNITIENIPIISVGDIEPKNIELEDINIENMPIIPGEDLQVYEEIIVEGPITNTDCQKQASKKTKRNDDLQKPLIISNLKLSDISVATVSKTDLKHCKKISLHEKIKKTKTKKNYYDDSDEILKILEQD